MLLSKTPAEKQNLGAAFSGMGNKIGMTTLLGIFETLINSDKGWDYSQERQQDYLDYFWTQLKDNRYGQKAIQDAITDPQEMAELENYYPSLMSIIFRVVRQDYNDKRHKNHMRLAGSFAANAEAILQGHVPEIYCAWLRSYDSYYANEGTAYRWASEAGTPGKVNFYVSANGTEAAWGYEDYDNLTTLNGDQTVKLNAEKSGDAVYYYIADATKNKDERGNNSVRLLYNAGQGIKLAAPKEGQPAKIYKVYAFTKNSYSTGNANIVWKKSDAEWFRCFKVAPAIPEGVHLKLVKHYYDGNTRRWVESADPTVVHTGVPFKLNNRFSVDLKTVKEIDLEKYYVKSWSAPKQTGSMDINTTVIRFIPEYENQDTVTVELFPRIHHVETVCLLSNRKPDARVKIDVDLEDYYRIKDEQKKNKASE